MAGATAVPVRPTVWGLPVALSLIISEAVRVPVAVGVKVTLIVQLEPAATEEPHVLVWAKSALFAPVIARLAIVRVAEPVLVKVIVSA